MVDTNSLKAKMFKEGYTQGGLAKKIGISENTMTSRITGKSSFTLKEVADICKVLHIVDGAEKAQIFLA